MVLEQRQFTCNNLPSKGLYCKLLHCKTNCFVKILGLRLLLSKDLPIETLACTAMADKFLIILLPTPYFKKTYKGKGKAMACQYRIMNKANLENNTHTKLTV